MVETLKKETVQHHFMTRSSRPQNPLPFFYLYIIPAALINLVFVFYPLIIEGMIIGDRAIPVREIDLFIAYRYFGGYNRDAYISFLMEVYALSILVGVLVAFGMVGPTFRKLLSKNEVVLVERTLGVKLAIVVLVPVYGIYLGFDRVLAFLMGDPTSLPGFSSDSFLSTYVLAGFLVGLAAMMSSIPLRASLKCRRDNLSLSIERLDETFKRGRRYRSKTRLAFRKKSLGGQ